MGAPLFSRSQDGLRLTPLAQRLLPHAEAMEVAARTLMRSATQDGGSGSVRIAAGTLAATELLLVALASIRSDFPDLRLQLIVADGLSDLMRREVDVAGAEARPMQDGVVVSRLATIGTGLFAAAAWVKDRGMPTDADDLLARKALIGDAGSAGIASALGTDLPLDPAAFALATEDAGATLAAIAAGVGMGILPVVVGDRSAGLVRVLPECSGTFDLWLFVHADLRTVPQVRIVLDALRAALPALF